MNRTDESIKKDVVDAIFWDNRVDASTVKVAVVTGRVKLEGEVPTYFARRAAHEDAALIDGVRAIDNDLNVRYRADLKMPSDETLEANVRQKLAMDPDIWISDLEVQIEERWVTLKGTVDQYWKKLRAENVVSDTVGVVGVTNSLAVVPSRDVLDATIASDIVAALERSFNSDIDELDVTVQDGVVTLAGSVPHLNAARTARRMAERTTGVVDVVDKLSVDAD